MRHASCKVASNTYPLSQQWHVMQIRLAVSARACDASVLAESAMVLYLTKSALTLVVQEGQKGVEAKYMQSPEFHEAWKAQARDMLARAEFRKRKLTQRVGLIPSCCLLNVAQLVVAQLPVCWVLHSSLLASITQAVCQLSPPQSPSRAFMVVLQL